MTERPSGNVLRFVGLALAVIGALWLALSGLCVAAMLISMLSDMGVTQEVVVYSIGILIVSGISAAMAYGVFIVGRGLWTST